MNKLCFGNFSICKLLKKQYEKSAIKSIEKTGKGFYVNFEIDSDVELINLSEMTIGDVNIHINNDPYLLAGEVLFITEGKIDFLELYVYTDSWPEEIKNYELLYDDNMRSFLKDFES